MTRPTPYDGSPALFPSCDGDLAYLDTGPPQAGAATPALVLLHPGWTDHTLWSEVVPLLAARHRVIAPDARGHGASANASRPFRPCDDLAGLLRHLGTGPAALIGCSMGADTAVATALEHPDLVRALVLSGGGSGRNMELRTPWAVENAARQQAALAAGDLPGWAEHFAHGAVGPQRQPGDLSPELLDRIRTAGLRTLSKHTPDEPDHHIPVPDLAARAAALTVPVLAVNGALDVPELAAHARHVADSAPWGRTVTLPDAGHFAPMERPGEFVEAVGEFLREAEAEAEAGRGR
ncbi:MULTISPECIES: alpha/beta fold hydrolase [Streptomyces]|uniref:Alpha/beta hydrolase n=3 Tax=Streptomyces TaxID=1883 RepID=A0A7Y6F2L3_9ACTN|nr:alpha/beta hydrolase [Streptomyces odorifer]NUV29907.1 alpha/beta hydrolase [Streptomyces odorifer]NUV49729.1 alpha/beta hydrolase [Streptomyces sp. CAI-78]